MPNVGRLVKESAVKQLSERLAQHPEFLVTAITRLPSVEADSLRQKLFASQARLIMVKQTFGRRMMGQLDLSAVTELFEGSVGLVLPGEEILPAAKVLIDFIKTHEEQIAVRGAFIDGMVYDKARVEQLASLPPKPVLLAQVVATIEAPLADVIFTLERLLGDVMWVAEQAAAQKPAESAPTTEPGAPSSARGGDGSAAGGGSPRRADAETPEAASTPEPPKPETEQPKAEQPPTTQEGSTP
ncbi:MAG: 50S ribosomal protein L10 [Candidatus Omnitrophica bacterium]|nr:50S ribosomal protein L10 [Candidatus Omnitrophota bacterium]